MKVTLESTNRIVQVEAPGGGTIPGRVWEGTTPSGIFVSAVITRLATPLDADQSQFLAELSEQSPVPQRSDVWPNRMVV